MNQKKCKAIPFSWTIILIVLFDIIPLQGQSGVKIWEEAMVISTYRVGNPDPNPRFYTGRAYQGARGRVYPYPMLDKLTDNREEKAYNAVYLENRYIKLCVLPEIGGRIFYATDKTNGYELFYRQHVIKPALIGMLGAWISGGVEWCIPHHHRATTFMEVDYTLRENADGRKTVWIGEMELRHRMKWIIGLTLYPDQSIIEVTVKFFNRTPFVHSFLYWANVAVHANENYQVIFPPSTEFATYHGKNQFTRWPISHEYYHRVDYTRGVDVSWWKNLPAPTSMFAWNCEENFLAGYDHGKEAGIIHVADHHIVPGKKLWTWGTGSPGKIWEKILTETDGPYLELMVGAYSDNQPDYSWIQPYEVKTFRQVWYPLRNIGGVKNANEKAAVNLEITGKKDLKISLNTSSKQSGAKIVLKTGEKILFEKNVDIGPDKPFVKKIRLLSVVDKGELEVNLYSRTGEELIRYRPVKREKTSIPELVKPPPDPEEIETVEELYLAGLRLEQFYNPTREPYPYYEEAVNRDPDNVRANTALGILLCKRGMFREAEDRLRRAVERVTNNYTSPREGEALYYLGVALRAQDRIEEAYDVFSRAAWDAAYRSAASYQLAELDLNQGNPLLAMEHLNRSLTSNTLNTRSLNLKTAVLRRMGRLKEAERVAKKVASMDPLDFWAGNEIVLIRSKVGQEEGHRAMVDLQKRMRNDVQSYLELAMDYGNCGFRDEAIDVLSRLTDSDSRDYGDNPLVFYYLGYFWEKKGDEGKSRQYYKKGREVSPAYCYPFRLETLSMLRHVSKLHPEDSMAPYYLGNLLFDFQPEEAIEAWEKSKELDEPFGMVYRNLGFASGRVNYDFTGAIAHMERAVTLNKNDARLYYELDLLYEMAGVPAEKRLALLRNNHDIIIERDDALSREIILSAQLGHYDKAVDLMANHHFHTWEGGGQIHNTYVDTHLLRGLQKFEAGESQGARMDFEAALEYPENLEVGRPIHDIKAYKTSFFIGMVWEALGQAEKARTCFEKASQIKQEIGWSEILFFQGLAMQKLGRQKEAEQLFDRLISTAEDRLKRSVAMDFFTKFGEKQSREKQKANTYYLLGLGYLGKDRKTEAESMFEKALELNKNHLWARMEIVDILIKN